MNPSKTSSIGRLFALTQILVVVAILILAAIAVIFYNTARLEDELETRMEQLTLRSQVSLSTALGQFNDEYIKDYLASLFLHEEVVMAQVSDGKRLVTSLVQGEGKGKTPKDFKGNDDYLIKSATILHQKHPVGKIVIVITRSKIRQSIINNSLAAMGLGGLLIAALFLTNILISRAYLLKPLSLLKEETERIAGGDLETPIELKAKGEINLLANNLDSMRLSLKDLFEKAQRTDELARLNQELEIESRRRLEVQEGLRQERDLAQKYLDVAGVMILALDRKGRVTQINRQGCQMLEGEEKDILGRNWFDDFLPPEFSPRVKKIFEKLIINQGTSTGLFENDVLTLKDNLKHLTWHNVTLRNNEGRVTGTLSSGLDITQQLKAEKDKELLQEQLRQSQKMESIGTLAGGVAHDFNNILSAIIGFSELCLEDAGDAEPLKHNIEQVLKSSWRARNLVGQLLAFSRKQVLEMSTFNFNDVTKHNKSMLGRILGEDIDLEFHLDPEIGLVKADFHQFEQVLLNLVANSRDAMPIGGKLTIETQNVYLDEEYAANHPEAKIGPHVMLAVSDDGPGIPEDTRERMFDPFFTTKEVGKGTGMGLAMVYGIVKQHGGNIYVYSEPGQGTSFKIYLPRVDEESDFSLEKFELTEITGGNETILVVEDEEIVLDYVCRALERLGYHILKAGDGDQALAEVAGREQEIDLLLTDVVMPRMNGRELNEKLTRINPDLKTVYTSGYTDNVIAHHGVLYSGVAFLQKPVTLAHLAAMIRKVLDGK